MDPGQNEVGKSGRWPGLTGEGGLAAGLWFVVAIGIGLRATALFQPMGYDEAFTYREFARQGPGHLLSVYTHPNNHILHTLGVWLSSSSFGNHPWTLRLPAFIAGCGLLPVAAVVLRRLTGRRAALLGVSWLAVAWPLVHYSASARGYSMQAVFVLIAVGLADRLRRGSKANVWAAFVVVMAVAFWTLPTTLFAFGGLMLWIAMGFWRADATVRLLVAWRNWLAAGAGTVALTALFYAPVLANSGTQALIANEYTRPWTASAFLERLCAAPGALANFWTDGVPLLLCAVWGVGGVLALLMPRRAEWKWRSLWFVLVLWSVAVVVAQQRVPPPRVWTFALPLFIGGAAWGIVGMLERWAPRHARGVVMVLALVSALGTAPRVLQHVAGLTEDLGQPAALAAWLGERASNEPISFAAHFVLGHRVLYYAERRGVTLTPTHRAGALLVWRWGTATGARSSEITVLLDDAGEKGFEEFVTLLETHTGGPVRVEGQEPRGSVAVRSVTLPQ